MAQNKTVPDGLKVSDYLAQIEPAQRQADCQRLYDIMLELTGWTPKIWGSKLKNGIVGFGDYHYKYCLLYTSPSPRDKRQSRMPSSA